MSGASIMAVALIATGWWMYVDVPQTPQAVVVCVIVFNAAFGFSWGPIPWLYPPEIMPLTVRAKGVSLSTATNWAFNFLVGEMTPVLQDTIRWRLYPLHGFFCVCSFIVVYFLYPETKGVPLEEMDEVFCEEERAEDEDEEEEESERALLRRHSVLTSYMATDSRKPPESMPERGLLGWLRRPWSKRGPQESQSINNDAS